MGQGVQQHTRPMGASDSRPRTDSTRGTRLGLPCWGCCMPTQGSQIVVGSIFHPGGLMLRWGTLGSRVGDGTSTFGGCWHCPTEALRFWKVDVLS